MYAWVYPPLVCMYVQTRGLGSSAMSRLSDGSLRWYLFNIMYEWLQDSVSRSSRRLLQTETCRPAGNSIYQEAIAC